MKNINAPTLANKEKDTNFCFEGLLLSFTKNFHISTGVRFNTVETNPIEASHISQ